LNEYEIYAAGLGLLFSSPEPLHSLVEGKNYSGSSDPGNALSKLYDDQRMFLLATGSPELDYVISFYETNKSSYPHEAMIEEIQAGIEIVGGSLVIRDGYDLLDWEPAVDYAVEIPIEDGYYRLTIGWSHSGKNSTMNLHILAQKSDSKIEGRDMYELIYEIDQ